MDGTGSGVTNRVRIAVTQHLTSGESPLACIASIPGEPRGAPGDLHADRPSFSVVPVAVRPLADDDDRICEHAWSIEARVDRRPHASAVSSEDRFLKWRQDE